MARMSVDDKFLREPRLLRLCKQLGIGRREGMGTFLCVWAICYDRVTPVISAVDIDTAAEIDGFSTAMVACGLGIEVPEGVYVCGAEEHIGYLERQAERGRKGGVESGKSRMSKAALMKAPLPKGSVRFDESKPKLQTGKPLPSASASASASAPDPALPTQNMSTASTSRSRPKSKCKDPEYSEDELATVRQVLDKLSTRTQVKYEGGKQHTAIIVRQLRLGRTRWDLRRVIAYCAGELGWESKPEMKAYLRPETLFGPQTIERYLDPARSWQPEAEEDYDKPKDAPVKLSVVRDDNDEPAWFHTNAWMER